MKKTFLYLFCSTVVAFTGLACSSQTYTESTKPVANLDLTRYMGSWYEIARLPHSFQKDMNYVKATYTLQDNGRVHVLNEGKKSDGEHKSATARAYRPDGERGGHLRVSFVPPYCWFYGSYNVIDINEEYTLAVVSGSSTSMLWLLSRTPQISEESKKVFLEFAQSRGFDTSAIIWTEQ